ncbi:unnamed protein product [Closterium sp. Naga37s-1]|nr:unnamed protein product [Closterium sp. Naga37s-1]
MSNYYDLDDILAEDEKLPVTFRTGATGVGRALDPSTDADDLAVGAKVDLPVWMVPALAKRNMVSALEPRMFGERIRKEVQADAACVNLRACSPYYYSLGTKIAPWVRDKTLTRFLFTTFVERYADLLTRAFVLPEKEVPRVRRLLPKEEQQCACVVLGKGLSRGETGMNRGGLVGIRVVSLMVENEGRVEEDGEVEAHQAVVGLVVLLEMGLMGDPVGTRDNGGDDKG